MLLVLFCCVFLLPFSSSASLKERISNIYSLNLVLILFSSHGLPFQPAGLR